MFWYPILEVAAFLWALTLVGGLIAAFVYGPSDERGSTAGPL
jgi:hypothetical protein